MTTPSSAQASASSASPQKDAGKQTDKQKRLAQALRRNLLRRKTAAKGAAPSDDTQAS